MRKMAAVEISPRKLEFDGTRPLLKQQEILFEFAPLYQPPASLLSIIGQVSEMKVHGEEVKTLAGGLPPTESLKKLWGSHFPSSDVKIADLIKEGRITVEEASQYGSALGVEKLRAWAAKDISLLTGKSLDKKQILITGGGLQYGLSASLLALCAAENKVALTSKDTYSAFLEAAEIPARIPVFAVQSDSHGMIPKSLDESLTQLEKNKINPGLVYAMAVGNPDGLIMPDDRGGELNEVCKRHNVPFFVDYAYYKLILSHVTPDQIPRVNYLDDNVILGFTTSKLGAPGERVGYMAITDEDKYARIRSIKQAQMISSAARPELAYWLLAESAGFDSAIHDLVRIYETGIDSGLAAVGRNSDVFKTDRPGGGMFIKVHVPPGLSTLEFSAEILHESKIAYSPGILFQPGQIMLPSGDLIGPEPDDTYMRLCMVTETPQVISDTMDNLAQSFRRKASERNVVLFNN